MNLMDRYLQAVAKCLPGGRRSDIVSELRADIVSEFEDRESELGRPLTEDEQAAILRRHGNPAIVAGRYHSDNLGLAFGKQWIGPELFPFYKTIVAINFAIMLFVLAGVVPAIALHTGGTVELTRIYVPLVIQFVVVTVIFILVDRNKERVCGQWDPRKLPPVQAHSEDGPNARSIFNFIATAMGTAWLVLIAHWPSLLMGPIPMRLMPRWQEFYWAVVALLCAQLAVQFFSLFRLLPTATAQNVVLGLKCVGLCINAVLLWKAPNYVSSPYKELADWANTGILICLIATMVVNGWSAARSGLLVWHQRHQGLQTLLLHISGENL